MTGAGSRRKGHSFERGMAIAFRDIYPAARRGIQSRAGDEAPDVEGTPYWIECKRGKKTNIRAALAQAKLASDGRPCVAICKDDREPATVTLGLGDFLKLVGEANIDLTLVYMKGVEDGKDKIRNEEGT